MSGTLEFVLFSLREEQYIRSYIAQRLINPKDVDKSYQTILLVAYHSRKNSRGDSSTKEWISEIAKDVVMLINDRSQ